MEEGLLSLKWNNHRSTFTNVLYNLRRNELHTDATLACEGKFFPVHKLILSVCSNYFNEAFKRTSCKSPVVILKGIKSQELVKLLDYMYMGEVDVRQNELASIIKAAECLEIKGLAVPDEVPVINNAKTSEPQDKTDLSPSPKRRRTNSGRMSETSPVLQPSTNDGSCTVIPPSVFPVETIKLENEDTEKAITGEEDMDYKVDISTRKEAYAQKLEAIDKYEHYDSNVKPPPLQDDNSTEWAGVLNSTPEYDTASQHMIERTANNPSKKIPVLVCPICKKSFHGPYRMNIHMRTHTGEKPYACSHCSYRATQRGNLDTHLRTHTGEKPYKCTHCQYRSSQRITLRLHMTTKHRDTTFVSTCNDS